ncbi:MAG TPA: NifB/NifX family molybdenum-iron cluster-binding protein [Phycisphaerae bacterium]|nr:NifB/NifX family molybdenum-iron cluster-binding protein [Phycisphaerae bacterium]HNU43833.1 NifB/NifX family molybdenum-iron cluster-binding protein [Phycisphaerae bacterium]
MARVAFASDDGTAIAAHTGRCACFVIYNVADGQAPRVESRANTFTTHAQEGCAGPHAPGPPAGHHSHASLLDALADCQVLVTRGLGPRLLADLGARGIDVCVCNADGVEDAARLFAAGQLRRARPTDACGRSHR